MKRIEIIEFEKNLKTLDGIGTGRLQYAVFKNLEKIERLQASWRKYIQGKVSEPLKELENELAKLQQTAINQQAAQKKIQEWPRLPELLAAREQFNNDPVIRDFNEHVEADYAPYHYTLTAADLEGTQLDLPKMKALARLCPNFDDVFQNVEDTGEKKEKTKMDILK